MQIAGDRLNGIEHIIPSLPQRCWVAVFVISIITCIFQIELLYIITYLLSAQTSLRLHGERKRMNTFDRTESSALNAAVHSFHLNYVVCVSFHDHDEMKPQSEHCISYLLYRLSSIFDEMPENLNSWLSAPNFRWHENQLDPVRRIDSPRPLLFELISFHCFFFSDHLQLWIRKFDGF